mmetsp:Transcript_70858/g.196858  ORF Transcript_70858/g.196858 Transcript_70858/m.196858 type:complete len:213 (-) Transcript_70858:138-776(-)
MGACESGVPPEKPLLITWPVAGRGELARLIAAAGGLEIEETGDSGIIDKASYGSPGSVPLLSHGDLKMCQSLAIESYLASIAPKFQGLTAKQRAMDNMFCCIKEDVIGGCVKIIYGDKSLADEEVPKNFDKFFTVVEGLVPASGFINGLSFPTPADLAVYNMNTGFMPFVKVMQLGNYTPNYPKIKALIDRTAAAPGVKEYIQTTTTQDASM